jgi:ribosomal protein L11 methyltransferase
MTSSDIYFILSIDLPQEVLLKSSNERVSRDFLASKWGEYLYQKQAESSFLGIFEGQAIPATPLYDAGEAPADRNEVSKLKNSTMTFYFSTLEGTQSWKKHLEEVLNEKYPITIESKKNQDWNAKWREGFTGEKIPPFWTITPIWNAKPQSTSYEILMNPSLGFGTGNHETTQLCLEALGNIGDLKSKDVLDFGSGSGILSVGAAFLGAKVDSVEIDEMALQSAEECARLNKIEDKIKFSRYLIEQEKTYDLIVANILMSVLLEFSDKIVEKLTSSSTLILSGLLYENLEPTITAYQQEFQKKFKTRASFTVANKNEWYRLIFKIGE